MAFETCNNSDYSRPTTKELTLFDMQLKLIHRRLKRHHWIRERAAKSLGMGARTLYDKIQLLRHHGFEVKESPKKPSNFKK